MRRHQHIAELGPLLRMHGIKHVIICPGSRNAPLTQLFTSLKAFHCHSIVDERSAGYVALGMARHLREPVVVLTTSGTAVLNLAPSVAEAYHQQIPLFVITADRPQEKIALFNNQTIDQGAPFYAYTKGFYQVPLPVAHEEDLDRVIRHMESLFASALAFPAGPVHLNIPLEEPLYEILPPALDGTAWHAPVLENPEPVSDFGRVDVNTRILVLVGMGQVAKDVCEQLSNLVHKTQAVVIAENIANMPGDDFISQPELLLAAVDEDGRGELAPDLLISFGGQVVSKRLKHFLQKEPDLMHVEIDGDPATSIELLARLVSGDESPGFKNHFLENWKRGQERVRLDVQEKMQSLEYGNLWVINAILSAAPPGSVFHLGNSSTIRYSQLLPHREDLTYYSNRGTSGIDGCVSAAAGAAMVSEQMHILLVGDLSFIYDSNALWNRKFPENLKIVVLNDHGGGIFRLLEGPSDMEFFEEFSVTHHPASPALLAQSFGKQAMHVGAQDELGGAIATFFTAESSLTMLDVDTAEQENSRIFKEFLDIKK